MKKILLLVLTLIVCLSAFSVHIFAADIGSAGAVLASDVTLIKSGLLGEKISFSDTDIKSALCISDFKNMTLTSLPDSTEGTLYIGERRVSEGQTVKRRNIARLYFMPKDKEVTESSFKFKIDGASGEEFVCRLYFLPGINYAPKLKENAESCLSVTTQGGISVYGKIDCTDPEGDELSIMVISYPKDGMLSLEGYEFKYTPDSGYLGKDSFVFVIRDEYGNYSRPSEVKLNITERMSEVVYVDMEDSKSYNAALAMTAMGIMSGSRVGDDMYFSPDNTMSRAEFLTAAMKALGIRADTTLKSTYFDDNSQIPPSLVSYVATAARCGIINGSFDGEGLCFRPNDNITVCEAAIIMSNILELESDSSVYSSISNIGDVPVYARSQVGAMFEAGIFSYDSVYDMNKEVTREEAAEYLYKLNLK